MRKNQWVRRGLIAIGMCGWTAVARAEELAEEPAAMTAMEIFRAGGILMVVLGVVSVAGLAYIFYLAAVLRTGAVFPRGFLRDFRETVEADRLEEARALCGRDRSAMAAIAELGLRFIKRHPKPDPVLLKEMIEGEGARQAAHLQDQTQYLLDIGVIAPMIGLLGTVMGMLRAFNAVALDIAKARPMVLAGGVSQALVTTAAGLMVGIPAMAFYAFFRGRVSRLVALLETGAAEILTLFTERRS